MFQSLKSLLHEAVYICNHQCVLNVIAMSWRSFLSDVPELKYAIYFFFFFVFFVSVLRSGGRQMPNFKMKFAKNGLIGKTCYFLFRYFVSFSKSWCHLSFSVCVPQICFLSMGSLSNHFMGSASHARLSLVNFSV